MAGIQEDQPALFEYVFEIILEPTVSFFYFCRCGVLKIEQKYILLFRKTRFL